MYHDSEQERFDLAAQLLPQSLRQSAMSLITQDKRTAEEFRLRMGRSPTVLLPEGEVAFRQPPVTDRELEAVLEIATKASPYAMKNSMRQGFLSVRGGFRIGICGSCIINDGRVDGFKYMSGMSVRIARQISGAAAGIVDKLFSGSRPLSVLVISPPGMGKTTLLRDLVRLVSDGDRSQGRPPQRVGLADERGEIAALWEGRSQLDVGAHTDVIDGCAKSEAVLMLLRAMNPQVIALDEITAPADTEAILSATNCGAAVFATAHAAEVADLLKRPVYRELMLRRVFDKVVSIVVKDGKRSYHVEDTPVC